MKIGILSYPLNNNYGCYLQAYALVTILQRMGHEVTYIHRRHNKPGIKFRIKYFFSTIKKNILKGEWNNPFYRYEWLYMKQKGRQMLPFFEKYIPHTKPYYTSKELEKHCQSYDAIIVGSDQVWRAGLLYHIEDYYLEFLKNPKTLRISYAASFGKKEAGYTNKEIETCGDLISKFNAVSLREKQGIEIINDFGWFFPNAQVVLDPTLLLKKEDYQKLISTNKKAKKLFCYILDKTDMTEKVIGEVGEYLKLEPYNILKGKNQPDFRYESLESWLEYFNSASFVVTDSFHGTVFSIIFNIPFIVVCNISRGNDRLLSLLEFLGLQDRLYSENSKVKKIEFLSLINWDNINYIIQNQCDKSMDFIISALSCK